MVINLVFLISGILLSKVVGKRILKLNENIYIYLSTSFIFLMGVSLGLNRMVLAQSQSLLINSLILSLVLSLGSIIFTSVLFKLIGNRKNV